MYLYVYTHLPSLLHVLTLLLVIYAIYYGTFDNQATQLVDGFLRQIGGSQWWALNRLYDKTIKNIVLQKSIKESRQILLSINCQVCKVCTIYVPSVCRHVHT
jgi:hypothetical protein